MSLCAIGKIVSTQKKTAVVTKVYRGFCFFRKQKKGAMAQKSVFPNNAKRIRSKKEKMKKQKKISLLLTAAMLLGMTGICPAAAEEETKTDKTVYVSLSQNGEIVKDSAGKFTAELPVELTENKETLDDVFSAFHAKYCENGAEGYASKTGDYGLYVTRLWNDESGLFGYQVNGGKEAVMGLSHKVKDGDRIDAVLYKNKYPDTENYTAFNVYEAECFVGGEVTLTLSEAGYDENFNMIFSPCVGAELTVNGEKTGKITAEDGSACLSFDTVGEYVVSAKKTKTVGDEEVPAVTAPVCVVTVKELPDACVTVPKNAMLFVGSKTKHFVAFTELEPATAIADGDNMLYYYELKNNATYNYRVSGEEYITYGGTFRKTANFSLAITEGQLKPEGKEKTTVDRDLSSNSGFNVGDLYLNINPKGYLTLAEGEKYPLVTLRSWQAVDTVTNNYFIEPDYHFSVLDENGAACDTVVSIDENGVLCAEGNGTAIVLVRYDAMTLNFGKTDDFYGATFPENIGVFVVSVGGSDSDLSDIMTINKGKNDEKLKLAGDRIDSEFDCIYFEGEKGAYTFTPEAEGVSVSVANPEIDDTVHYGGFTELSEAEDGSFTVPLTEGRNIVKLEKDGDCDYRILRAKKVNITVNGGEAVHAGDALSIRFDTLYNPIGKLAGVYNPTAIVMYNDVSGYEGQKIGGTGAQYNFASNAAAQTVSNILTEKTVWGSVNYVKSGTLTVPADYPYDTFTLSDGCFYTSGFGDSYGNHRFISLETGRNPNLNAGAVRGFFGSLPAIEIPITATDSPLAGITLSFENGKTEYFVGEEFDAAGLTVTAKYEDGTEQIATNYTVEPKNLSADTEKVTVTYKGFTAELPVTVKTPAASEMELTSLPSKTAYTEGEVFNPSGMTVTVLYENGVRAATSEYTYSPNRTLTTEDTEITVTYTGKTLDEKTLSETVTITVSKKQESGGGSVLPRTINVYFTLLGDELHGAPEGKEDTHTLRGGNLETWIPKTKITLEKGSSVLDAVEKALSFNGIPYTNEGNYISEIRGLAEFSNGDLSGWMYTLNGQYPNLGVEEQILSSGDKIVFHYTDDYTREKTTFSSGGKETGTAGGSTSTPVPKDPVVKRDPEEEEKTDTPDKKNFEENTFSDVKKDDWFFDSVRYVYENNLMQGEGEVFLPKKNTSRAMLVTILWRLENNPASCKEVAFADVRDTDWYFGAVRWAFSEGIVKGVSEERFGADEPLTREQAATILYRYLQKKDSVSSDGQRAASFSDYNAVSDYAKEAVDYAVEKGLIVGDGGALRPAFPLTRAEIAAILMRFCEE